ASDSEEYSANGPTATRFEISPRRRWATRRSFGSRASTAMERPPTAATAAACSRCSAPDSAAGRLRVVGRRDVDRRAAGAANADLLRHLHRLHRRCEEVAAFDADVVIGP